jgi:hypothetical protein
LHHFLVPKDSFFQPWSSAMKYFVLAIAPHRSVSAFAGAPFNFCSAATAFHTGAMPTNAQLLGKWKLVGLAKQYEAKAIYNLDGIVSHDGSLRDELGFENQKKVLDRSTLLLVGVNGIGRDCKTQGRLPYRRATTEFSSPPSATTTTDTTALRKIAHACAASSRPALCSASTTEMRAATTFPCASKFLFHGKMPQ